MMDGFCRCMANLFSNVLFLHYQRIVPFLFFYSVIDDGTFIWVEVCDSLRACAVGPPTLIRLAPGDARTIDALIEDLQLYVLRCEIVLLKRLVTSAIFTYTVRTFNLCRTSEQFNFEITVLTVIL